MNNLLVVTTDSVKYADLTEPLDQIGGKALGLLQLPSAWVPSFFIIDQKTFASIAEQTEPRQTLLLQTLAERMQEALTELEISSSQALMLRSNAAHESVDDRGLYHSILCKQSELLDGLQSILSNPRNTQSPNFGLLVQPYIGPIAQGHLSNERRVAEERRDALVEFEDALSKQITHEPISYRAWRDRRPPQLDALLARNRSEVIAALRQPLKWAAQKKKRVHFEWIWDGDCVHIVQSDEADQIPTGYSPLDLLHSYATVDERHLNLFHSATEDDKHVSHKLHNHQLYAEYRFWQPSFFVMDNNASLAELVSGTMPAELAQDLAELTVAPLLIRTASASSTIPLLPRSPLLSSATDAQQWLLATWRDAILSSDVDTNSLSLLAHHYVPALGSALSAANPRYTDVTIETTWGTPETLYYFPCDVFRVDTLAKNPDDIITDHISVRDSKTHKPFFVMPNADGFFVRHRTAPPWDWKSPLSDPIDLGTIARFTRQLAHIHQRPISLMWFLDCRLGDKRVKALPWYHEEIEERSPPRQHCTSSRDEVIEISTEQDLDLLESRAKQNDPSQSGRLIIELSPTEDISLRSESFAKRVGNACHSLDGVIKLRGATLSHIFYVIQRTGATVVTDRQVELDPRRTHHGKLVRDMIPERVAAGGEVPTTRQLPPALLRSALKIKLVEEAFEVRDASPSELAAELADVLEVVWSLADASGISEDMIAKKREAKARKGGRFTQGQFLYDTESGRTHDQQLDANPSIAKHDPIATGTSLPTLERTEPGPRDRRYGSDFTEIVQDARISLTSAEWTIDPPDATIISDMPSATELDWRIEGSRQASSLKLRIKIRVGSAQRSLF